MKYFPYPKVLKIFTFKIFHFLKIYNLGVLFKAIAHFEVTLCWFSPYV